MAFQHWNLVNVYSGPNTFGMYVYNPPTDTLDIVEQDGYFTNLDGDQNLAVGDIIFCTGAHGSYALMISEDIAGALNTVPAFSQRAVTSVTEAYTATRADEIILADGTFTVTLYSAVGFAGITLIVKNIGTGLITLDGDGTETIDGSLIAEMNITNMALTLISDGANWRII